MSEFTRVLVIPPTSGNFHFTGPEAQTFYEVDWFNALPFIASETEKWKADLTDFIMQKPYSNKPLLILHENCSFTLNYKAE